MKAALGQVYALTVARQPSATTLLQRKCSCGGHTVAGGECAECTKRKNKLQRKLRIGAANDPLEHEAERVAEQVMRSPAGAVSPAPPSIQRMGNSGGDFEGDVPESVTRTLAGSGRALDAGLREDMEARFGRDFSGVRVHQGGLAERSAREVNARAYTVGRDVVFGAGEYAPGSRAGRRLIVHELAHVVQQQSIAPFDVTNQVKNRESSSENHYRRNSLRHDSVNSVLSTSKNSSSNTLLRTTFRSPIAPVSGCTAIGGDASGESFLFVAASDDFRTDTSRPLVAGLRNGEEGAIRSFAMTLLSGDIVSVHGFASLEGDQEFNEHLSCLRALKAVSVIESEASNAGAHLTFQLFKHGATQGSLAERRCVIIDVSRASSQSSTTSPTVKSLSAATTPSGGSTAIPAPTVRPETTAPQGPPALPHCGPDATDWFVRQVNTAARDPDVLSIKSNLARASGFARLFGLTVAQLGEAAGATAVLGQEALLSPGAPTRNPAITSQLAAGSRSVAAVNAAAPAALAPPPLLRPLTTPNLVTGSLMAQALAAAALGWRALVNHGARYDFKAHVMKHPAGGGCPDLGCPSGPVGIITLCPGSASGSCFESDRPGNLFYGLIGRHVGWSETTLQLGSQYAELTDTARPVITWDTPDDTAAINIGYALPLPLSIGALCGSIGASASSLSVRSGCADCISPTTAPVM